MHLRLEAKYQIPRDVTLKTAYRASKIQRSKIKIHGVWAFGYVLRIAILEETTSHGSSLVHELLSLAMEDVVAVCRERSVAPPDTLVICGDNTVKELKNTVCLSYAAQLVLHQKLKLFAMSVFA